MRKDSGVETYKYNGKTYHFNGLYGYVYLVQQCNAKGIQVTAQISIDRNASTQSFITGNSPYAETAYYGWNTDNSTTRQTMEAMFAYLGEQLTHTDIEKLRKILPDIMKEINAALRELSLDAEAGLLIHISCCIDRLLAKQEVATNPRKAAILLQYDKEFKKLLKIVKPLEKTFHVIINDDEIANILTIIYQL